MPRLIFLRRGAGDSAITSSSLTLPLLAFDFTGVVGLGVSSATFLASLWAPLLEVAEETYTCIYEVVEMIQDIL